MNNAIGMVQHAMKLDTELTNLVASNIANSHTPGYLRKIGVENHQVVDNSFTDALSHSVMSATKLTIAEDVTPGTVSQTREPLDIALSGPGWLICKTDTGYRKIRGGRFHVNGAGTLVTNMGEPVLGVGGPIQFSSTVISSANIEVKTNGEITESGRKIGALEFSIDGNDSVQNPAPQVLQGYLETSNVNAVNEIIKLMEIVRHFEACQHAVKNYDGMLERAISDLGKI